MLNVTVNDDVNGQPCSATVECGDGVVVYITRRVASDGGGAIAVWNTGVEIDSDSVLDAVASAVSAYAYRVDEYGDECCLPMQRVTLVA